MLAYGASIGEKNAVNDQTIAASLLSSSHSVNDLVARATLMVAMR